ncbi:hypothetical protein [Kiloniella litopenaei]|uniref:hypothetical protein n=1 Tax=Kiloniella litopenaei TaxID=1549748 RepID=UPI003BA891B6
MELIVKPNDRMVVAMSQQERRVGVSLLTTMIMFGVFGFYMFGLYQDGAMDGPDGFRLIGKSFFVLVGGGIVVSIVVHILFTIIHSIITKDYEPMMNDERDKLFDLKSMQIILLVFSFGFMVSMGILALDILAPSLVFLLIIFSMFIANVIGDLVKLFLYRGGI